MLARGIIVAADQRRNGGVDSQAGTARFSTPSLPNEAPLPVITST